MKDKAISAFIVGMISGVTSFLLGKINEFPKDDTNGNLTTFTAQLKLFCDMD